MASSIPLRCPKSTLCMSCLQADAVAQGRGETLYRLGDPFLRLPTAAARVMRRICMRKPQTAFARSQDVAALPSRPDHGRPSEPNGPNGGSRPGFRKRLALLFVPSAVMTASGLTFTALPLRRHNHGEHRPSLFSVVTMRFTQEITPAARSVRLHHLADHADAISDRNGRSEFPPPNVLGAFSRSTN